MQISQQRASTISRTRVIRRHWRPRTSQTPPPRFTSAWRSFNFWHRRQPPVSHNDLMSCALPLRPQSAAWLLVRLHAYFRGFYANESVLTSLQRAPSRRIRTRKWSVACLNCKTRRRFNTIVAFVLVSKTPKLCAMTDQYQQRHEMTVLNHQQEVSHVSIAFNFENVCFKHNLKSQLEARFCVVSKSCRRPNFTLLFVRAKILRET
jgi:hypothetical protein